MNPPRHFQFGRYDFAAFLGFFVYASGTVVVPVALVSLAEDLGFSLEAGGMTVGGALHFGRTVTLVAAMLLCGFVAGRLGKRRTLGLSAVLLAVGLALCAAAPTYGVLLAALLVAGAGEGVIEGLATPFVQDLHPEAPGRYLNFTHAFWSIGVLVTVLTAGALLALGVSWRRLVAATALPALLLAGLLLWPGRAGHTYPEHPEPLHWKTVAGQARAILRRPRFWLFFSAMFLAGGGEFCVTYWSASYLQLTFGLSAFAGGAGLAFFAAGMVLGRMGWGAMIRQQQLAPLVCSSALAGTLITLFLPQLAHPGLFMGLLFFAGLATAPFWPSVQSYATDRLPGADTTMLLILLSCAGIPGCGFFTWLMGFIANHSSLRQAFYLVPACYLLLALLILTERAIAVRGGPSPCALPRPTAAGSGCPAAGSLQSNPYPPPPS